MIKQQLQLKLSQKLSPQQIQLMKLIQLSTQELEQKIQSEIGENPALENGIERTNNENEFDEGTKIEAEEINIDQLKKIISKMKPSNLNSLIVNKKKDFIYLNNVSFSYPDEKKDILSTIKSLHECVV